MTEPFRKADGDKPDPSLLPPRAVLRVVEVLTHGAGKYGRDNWVRCDDKRRYVGATLRHVLAYMSGEVMDPESGLPHLAHAACSLLFRRFSLETRIAIGL